MYVCLWECMHAMYVCLFLPGASLHVQTDVLRLSRVAEVRLLHLSLVSVPSLLSFHQHLFFGGHVGDTCVPAAAQRNQVTLHTVLVAITAGVAGELAAPYLL